MAVTVKELTKTECSIEQHLIGWMLKRFDGTNAGELANQASKMAVKSGYISGDLWEEIGPRYLHGVFTDSLRTSRRQALRPKAADEGSDEWERSSAIQCGKPKAEFQYLPGINQWVDILNVRKSDIKRIAAAYENIAKGNAFERDFWRQIESKLKDNQVVGDVFDLDSLRELRRKIGMESSGIKI